MAVEISQGVCDLCGAPSDASLQECNWLTCTYQHCEGGLYHQECLEKYLKSNKLEKNRKTGFKCPRGCGKGTRFDQACPGRIDKSHPIHPRNEDKKKTKLAAVVVEPQRPAKPAAAATQNGKAGKTKEDAKPDAGKDSKSTAPTKAPPAAKPAAAASAVAAPALALGSKAVRKDAAALPPRPEAVAKQKLAEQVALARRELGLSAANTSLSTQGSKGDLQMLASSAAGPSKPANSATPSAWGKPPSPATEPMVLSPQPTMMSQLPQFQQLLQQAAGKKQAAGKTAVGQTTSQAAVKPAPAVPQPVTPPTPVWPALGAAAAASQQTSAAALFSASGAAGSGSTTSSWQTSREAASNRPGSPPSAWGGASSSSGGLAAATASSSSQQQQHAQSTQQQPAAQQAVGSASTLPPASAAGSRGAAAGAASTSAAGASTVGSGGAAASTSGAGTASGSSAAGMGTSTSAVSAAAATSTVGASSGLGGSAGSGAGAVGSSGRTSVSSDAQPSAATGLAAAGAGAAGSGATASTSSSSRGAEAHLVGAEFVDEEAKEPKLTKAQKKNLKRIEKKKSPLSASGEPQQGGAGERAAGGPDLPDAPAGASQDGVGVAAAAATAAGHSVGTRQADEEAGGAVSGSGRGLVSGAHHHRQPSRGSEEPEQVHHIAEAEEAAVMEELCINCIVARKFLSLITQLQRLGALEYVAAAAVQRFGSNLLAALEWLLVAGADAAAAPPESVLTAAAESASAAESEIDISEELQQLHDLQAAMGVPTELLQQCVLDCNGDVQTAANTAMERMLAAPSGSASAAGAASMAATAGTSRAGGLRVSSGSGSGMVSGHSNGMALRGSPSYYSISSLDGGASVHDSEAAAAQQQKQQQSRSSHFGVRLQDEPVGCSNGGGSGYGVADAITSGFLRGGVVLGASGWQNGYLSQEARQQGYCARTPGAVASGPGGRNTSRLLHWLHSKPGRAAALEEEQAASGSGGFSADPVLDSPFSVQDSGNLTPHRGLGCSATGELNTPTLTTWLGSNGYHHHHHSGAGMASQGQGTGGSAQGLYGSVEHSTGNFSFASALSKPPSTESQLDSLCGYGSRWTSLAASDVQRQEGPTGLLFGPPGAATLGESEPAAHGDGDNDLSSIMALINVR